ncbi:MAG TPA: sigma 54-interacting transcriptional regulator [Candidatus Dormibacteraeota bacterium]|nr:sigma 54-interacting transcriptional regulator [Candidatus Dormibacteraeota bacterium]
MLEALVVDPNDSACRALGRRLVAGGWVAHGVASLAEARTRLLMRPMGAVFVAAELTDGEGVTLARELAHSETAVVVIAPAAGPFDGAAAIRAGACDVIASAADDEQLRRTIARVAQARAVRRDVTLLRDELRGLGRFGPLVGRSPAMESLYDALAGAAPGVAPVWLVGERGTGKRLAARTVHALSRREPGEPVIVECGNPTCDVELFGYDDPEAGESLSGALNEAAGGGLLLARLDEMVGALQERLAAFLSSAEGQHQRLPARILVTSTRPPDQLLKEGRLRPALWQHLQGLPIAVPPLRKRAGDVPLLAALFLDQLNRRHGGAKRLSDAALALLEGYLWPGNVRQLKQLVQQAFMIGDDELGTQSFAIDSTQIRAHPGQRQVPSEEAAPVVIQVGTSVADAEQRLVLATLAHCDGHKQRAAQILGISLKTLYNRLNAYKQSRAQRVALVESGRREADGEDRAASLASGAR